MAANSVTVKDAKASSDKAADDQMQLANELVRDLQTLASNTEGVFTKYDKTMEYVDSITLIDPQEAKEITFQAWSGEPSIPDVASPARSDIAEPEFKAIDIPNFGNIPELVLAEPILNIPSAPDASLPASPGNAPELNSAVLPVAPKISLPTPPSIQSLALPEAPAINVPVFSATGPTDNLLEPTTQFEFHEEAYKSDLLDAAKAKLIDDLVNGGYGIETADEEALWNRARERELLNAETQIQEAARQAAARGMMLPPGALNATISRIQTAALEKTSSVSRDIALKRADMYVDNRKFTLQQVQQVESMMLQYYGFVQERVLNASKYMVEFGIQLFNAKVSKFNAKLEAFRGAAQVYETQLRGALAHLDVYKAKVDGARLSVEAQQMYVSLYNAQLEGVKSTVELYRTQMEAAKVYTQVEMSKLDLFRSRVEAYQAQVGAKAAEFGMYETRLKGETTKVGLYEASVRAYATKVQAYQTGVAAKETQVRAQVAAAQLPLEQYKAKIQAFSADVNRYQSIVQLALGQGDLSLRSYGIQVDAAVKAVGERVRIQESNSTLMANLASLMSSKMESDAKIATSRIQIAGKAASDGLTILSQNATALRASTSGLVAEIQSA